MKKTFVMLAALILMVSMNLSVFAAEAPIVVDFSEDPDAFGGTNADGDWDYVNDSGKRVLYEECLISPDPADPNDTHGDVYGTVKFDPPIDAEVYKWLKISLKNVSPYTAFEFHYGGDKHGIVAEACTHFTISADDKDYKTYVINIPEATVATYPVHPKISSDLPAFWEGNISDFRIDFAYDKEPGGRVAEGTKMYIEYIAFFDSKEAADAWTFKPARGAVEKVTKAPDTQAPAKPAETKAPANETANSSVTTVPDNAETTAPSVDTATKDNTGLIIGIAAVGVVVIIVIIIVVLSKKKNEK